MADQLCCDHQETQAVLLPVTHTFQELNFAAKHLQRSTAIQQHSKVKEDAELRGNRQTDSGLTWCWFCC